MKQTTFATMVYENKKKETRREKFLREMNRAIPWDRLVSLIEPYYPKSGNGRRPMPLEQMLRIYFMQQWYSLSDPAMEDSLYDMESMRWFAKIEMGEDPVPDETTILNFRRLLEQHQLTAQLLEDINAFLEDKGLLLKGGSIVDASIIPAPSSTKNRGKKRNPEMSSTRKGNKWYFGMKVHVGVDAKSGLVHTVEVTTAKDHDVTVLPNLVREDDQAVFGDKGYFSDDLKREAREYGVYWGVLDKRKRGKGLSSSQKKRNRKHASIRAKVEHCFRIIKCQFGYVKTCYRELEKNAVQIYSLVALGNLYQVRHQLAKT
jgi:IS5 family transposase